jgi:hypothetical protein
VRTRRWRRWAELVAAISVVVSLVVLIVEVRANTKAVERQVLLDRTASVTGPFTSTPDLLAAFEKVKRVDGWDSMTTALMRRYGLEPGEATAWFMFLLNVWRGFEADFAYAGPSEELAASIRGTLQFPDNHLFYETRMFSPEFAAYVESIAPGTALATRESRTEVLAQEGPAHDAVRQALVSYYEVFSARDWSRFADHFWPGATLTTIWAPTGETEERVVATTVSEFVAQAPLGPGSREIFEERMTSARITVHGDLAQAWTEYEARFGDPGDVAEWTGIDAFTLLRHEGEWRISSLAYVADGN